MVRWIWKRNRVDKLIQPLVLKGRQAGMYIILAMQRPDAEYFPSGVRDNLTFRISVGRLSPIGYLMTFGEDFKNKPFYNKDQPGRGYAFPGFDVPVEFLRHLFTKIITLSKNLRIY